MTAINVLGVEKTGENKYSINVEIPDGNDQSETIVQMRAEIEKLKTINAHLRSQHNDDLAKIALLEKGSVTGEEVTKLKKELDDLKEIMASEVYRRFTRRDKDDMFTYHPWKRLDWWC